MADRRRDLAVRQSHGTAPHGANGRGAAPLTAAAQLLSDVDVRRPYQYESWQDEAWDQYCADETTEILTQRGWKHHQEVRLGDMVLTLDHETGTSGWEPVQGLLRYDVVDAPMLSIETQWLSSLTTMNHRWPVIRPKFEVIERNGHRTTRCVGAERAWTTSEKMKLGDRLLTQAPYRDVPTQAKYDDAFVELVGWYWTEGTAGPGRRITLSQSERVNPSKTARIRNALTKLYGHEQRNVHKGRVVGPPTWKETTYSGNVVFVLSVAAAEPLREVVIGKEKIVDADFIRSLTHAQLELFIDVSLQADGHRNTIGQASEQRIRAFEMACILAGKTPRTRAYEDRGWNCRILQRQTGKSQRRHRSIVKYTGTVWCPTTPSGTWLARRNGTVWFTGNCALGEFNYGVEWFGEACSRVRLKTAIVTPESDEPEIIDTGPAADLVSALVGGPDGQSQLMRSLAVQLSVAGDAFFIGREVDEFDIQTGVLLDAEPDENGRVWTVNPVNTVRQQRGGFMSLLRRGDRARRQWEVQVDDALWIKLPEESLVCRVWDRNERFPWRAMSPARPALPIMREIDMYNRQVIASLLSRIALNGFLLIPDEVTLPASPGYEDEVDPFMAELLDIMRAAIKNPGAPSSAAPVPLRIPAEYIEKVKHLTIGTPLDERLFEQRNQALSRLATTLNLPAEIITGLGQSNHWSAWNLTEGAIKFHISPKVEIITRCLTIGYLHPMLRALNENVRDASGNRIVVWYDTSELTQRPDRSANAIRLREMLVINDEATRRETGMNEDDAPTDDELEKMVLTKLAVNPQTAAVALRELTGLDIAPQPAEPPITPEEADAAEAEAAGEEGEPEASPNGPPRTQDAEQPAPDEGVTPGAQSLTASARRDALVSSTHSVRRRARASLVRR